MKVYLDDVRICPTGWVLAKTAREAMDLLKTNKVSHISLDHDLGDDILNGTGYDVISWIERETYTGANGFKAPDIQIHTSNTSARVRMELCKNSIKRKKYAD